MRKLLALICVALSIYSVLSSVQLDILVEPFVIAAVGRAARMCELYDARTDQFLRISLLKNNAPDSVIHTTHNRQTDLKYLMLNTLEEKLTSLDIRAELKLSALAGLIQVSGSGKFVGDKKHGARSVKVSLANLMTTLFEQIDLTGTEESNLIDLNVLANIEATHVVVGIQWGGNVFVSVEDTNYENEEHQNIQGSLGGKLSFLFGSISAEGEVKLNDTERNEFNKFSFELYGDVLPTITPTNLVEAIVAMKNSSRLLVDGNGGRGKAMSYHLLPITVFRDHMKVESQLNSYLQRIDDSTINACMRLFEEMEIVEEKIYDLMKDRNTFQHYLNKEKLDKIAVFANSFDDFKIKLKSTFVEHLILARSGNETIGEFLNVLHEGRQSTFSPNNIDFEQFYPIETEFRFLRHLVQLGVEMLDKRTSFQEFKSTNFGRNIYAFFYSVNFPTLMEEPMMVFKDIFSRRNTFDPLGIFVAVKIDVLREQEREMYFNFDAPTIVRVYRNGECISDDYRTDATSLDFPNQPELWSLYQLQTHVNQLLNSFQKLQNNSLVVANQLSVVQSNPVPIGFVYVQYPNRPAPGALWPTVKWQQITSDYAGQFFRAEGQNSKSFTGGVQDGDAPRFTEAQYCDYSSCGVSTYVHFPTSGWSDYLGTGGYLGSWTKIRFHRSNSEVRPRNQAIRIWQRYE